MKKEKVLTNEKQNSSFEKKLKSNGKMQINYYKTQIEMINQSES